jgi:CheY-like chemotaxis protein
MHPRPVELLLVEDNPGDILLIRQTLAHEPFPVSVHVALDGEQAIHMLAEQYVKPDLVILDLKLPKVSGLSFLERCQLEAPIVLFSSLTRPDDLRREFVQQVSQIVRNWAFPDGLPASAR